MNNVFLILGGNLGERRLNLAKATDLIGREVGVVKRVSSVYETQPWGVKDQPNYFNQVLEIITTLNADTLMETLLKVEKQMGRVRTEKYGARTIDIDILFFNDEIINSRHLTVPHPRLHERRFVLEPLAEIAPEFVHPIFMTPIIGLLKNSKDIGVVNRI